MDVGRCQALRALRAHVPDADDDLLSEVWDRLADRTNTAYRDARAALQAAAAAAAAAAAGAGARSWATVIHPSSDGAMWDRMIAPAGGVRGAASGARKRVSEAVRDEAEDVRQSIVLFQRGAALLERTPQGMAWVRGPALIDY
jgi:hypothetical protein